MAHPLPGATRPSTSPSPGLQLTQRELDELRKELLDLRERHQRDLAQRLRDAREHGSPADGDDLAAVHGEVSVEASRIARLEQMLREARIVDAAGDGGATVGCTVEVEDVQRGGTLEYRLVGHRADGAGRHDVTPASPVGAALMGATTGSSVRVALPGGRFRELRVLGVRSCEA